jgi:hypothetical protein
MVCFKVLVEHQGLRCTRLFFGFFASALLLFALVLFLKGRDFQQLRVVAAPLVAASAVFQSLPLGGNDWG